MSGIEGTTNWTAFKGITIHMEEAKRTGKEIKDELKDHYDSTNKNLGNACLAIAQAGRGNTQNETATM